MYRLQQFGDPLLKPVKGHNGFLAVIPPNDHTHAVFNITGIYYDLFVIAGDGGSVSGTASGRYASGTPIGVKATPAKGYRFTGWSVSGLPGNLKASASFNMPAGRVILTANFVRIGSGGNGGGGPANGNGSSGHATGDGFNLLLWVVLAAAMAGAICLLLVASRKSRVGGRPGYETSRS